MTLEPCQIKNKRSCMILSLCQIGAKLSNLIVPTCLITEKITYLILSQRSEEITYILLKIVTFSKILVNRQVWYNFYRQKYLWIIVSPVDTNIPYRIKKLRESSQNFTIIVKSGCGNPHPVLTIIVKFPKLLNGAGCGYHNPICRLL